MTTTLVLINHEAINNNLFMQQIMQVFSHHSLNASIFSAVIVNNKDENERYGALVSLSNGTTQDIVKIASALKGAFNQDHILVPIVAENLPVEFIEGRVCNFSCTGSLQSTTLSFHNRLRSSCNHPTRVSFVAWQVGEQVRFQSLYNPEKEPNTMVWQKNVRGIVQKIGIEALFTNTSVMVV